MSAQAAPASAPRGAFSAAAALWLVVVGVVSFLGLLVLSAYAPDLRKTDDGRTHALSRSALGYAGVVRLLQAQGRPVLISRGPLPAGRAAGLAVFTPDLDDDADAIEDIELPGSRLVVLPKWAGTANPLHTGWLEDVSLAPASPIAANLLAPYAPKSVIERREGTGRPALYRILGDEAVAWAPPGPVEHLQTFSGAGWTPVIVDETGRLVVGRVGQTFVLSDPDLLNTHGMKDIRSARAGLAIIDLARKGEGPIVFDVTLHGFERGRSFLRLFFEPPFLGVTLCLGIAALLGGLHAIARFGPVVRPPRALALGKRALADNTAGLIRMARREHKMGERYALACRGAVTRAIGAPRELDEAGLEAFLDRLSVKAGLARFTDLKAQAKGAANPAELVVAARKLHHWRVEMTRERR